MPTTKQTYKTIDSQEFFKSKDFSKRLQARKKRKTKRIEPEPVRMVVPDILVKAKQRIIKEIFGGEKAWATAHEGHKTALDHSNQTEKPGKAKKSRKTRKLGLENIGAIYVGQKYTKDKPTPYLCVVIEVFEFADEHEIRREYRIPKRIRVDGQYVMTDIKKGARVVPHTLVGGDICGNSRPSQAGTPEAGSIGCFCLVKITSQGELIRVPHILSNSHVFGTLMNPDVEAGDEVINFSPGSQHDVLGFLFDDGKAHNVDAAIASVKTGADVDPGQHRAFQLTGDFRSAQQGERVRVFGGNTRQVRSGTVGSTGRTQPVDYPTTGAQTLDDLFSIFNDVNANGGAAFSQGGDSGSVIVSDQNEILGILIGVQGDGTVLAQGIQSIVNVFAPDSDPNSFSFIPTT